MTECETVAGTPEGTQPSYLRRHVYPESRHTSRGAKHTAAAALVSSAQAHPGPNVKMWWRKRIKGRRRQLAGSQLYVFQCCHGLGAGGRVYLKRQILPLQENGPGGWNAFGLGDQSCSSRSPFKCDPMHASKAAHQTGAWKKDPHPHHPASHGGPAVPVGRRVRNRARKNRVILAHGRARDCSVGAPASSVMTSESSRVNHPSSGTRAGGKGFLGQPCPWGHASPPHSPSSPTLHTVPREDAGGCP